MDRSKPFRTDADPANTDTAANQTYTAPAENADLKTLATTLINLDATVENNTKLSKTMDEIGNSKNIPKGTVMEITEFGGWKAVDGGVFAIARRTEEGVYPLETINSTLDDTVWLREQAFDRDTEYTLLLSKTRTRANRNEATADGSAYKPKYEGLYVAKNVARYKGIEKIFKAYSTKEGSDVIIKFKPGYVGDMDGTKANYKVEVYSITGDQETKVYETTFDPSKSVNNDKMIVTPATDGTNKEKIRISNASIALPDGDDTNVQRTGFIGKREAEKLMARPENLPNGKAGTFTSKPIALPQGADHYKVRISLADQNRTGMSYQAWDEKYSIPVTGADFSIAQDTSRVAKSLLQRVYDKLLATVDADKRGKTLETQAAYQAQLDAIKALLDGELKSTDDYKRLVQPTLEAHKELKVDKSALTTSTGKLEQLVDDDPTRDKTPETVKVYNDALNAAKAEVNKANTVIADDSATVDQVAQAVADVRAKRAELRAARALLVVAATTEQKTKLQNDSDALKEADKTNKTPNSITEYNAKYKELEAALTAAKAQAKAVLDKTVNAGKEEATDAQIEVDKIKAELDKAAALLKDKGNTAELEKAKNALSDYITQQTNDNVTAGKTKDSQDAYAIAKTAADKAVEDAAAVIASENSTVEDVANALADIKVKKAELEAAKKNLVPAATDAQKAKLEESAAKLVKADTAGKTQESIDAYETTYNNLKTELDKAIEAAAAIKTAGDNASEHAALKAQEAVDAVQAKLDAAKATLVDKATEEQVAELRKAEAALTPAEESTLAGTKTPASIAAYKKAVDAIQSQLTEAKATAAALVIKAEQNNAKKVDAAEAIAKVDALKVELAKANALLKDKANTGDLAAAKEELKALAGVANVTDGKTTSTKDAYDAAKREADTAVTAAEGIINNADSSPEEVATALTNVKAKKAELEKAKTALLDKITQDQKDDLANAEEKLKLADTTGKTAESIKAYNDEVAKLSDDLAAAKQVAKDLLDKGDNAGELEAYRVQAKINKLKSKLAEAAKLLKDIDKSAAKKEVEDAAKKATDAIVANNDLTPDQKEAAKVKVAEEANKAIAAIEKATTEDDVTTATDAGKLGIEKEAAKAEIEAAKAAKEKAIEANTDLTPEQKAAAKAKVAEEATKATAAIDQATTKEAVKTATDTGKLGIEKEAEKAEIEAEKAAKEKAIDARTDLTDDEKAKVKAKVAEEAKKAIEAIENAKTHNDASAKTETGKDDIKKINPVGAKEEAKKAVEEALTNKEKEIDARTDLTLEGKNKEKALAREEAEAAKKAIEQATNIGEIEKALRPFLYQIDQDALVLDRPAFNIEAYIKVSVTGIVIAKRGNAITQADIIAKLNISENVTVNSIELPDTTTVGRKSAKVTLILADGTEAAVFVPVEVVESSEENHQQNNTQVKPQEDSKPTVVPSNNSEQPTVTQTEDVKENSSTTSQETKGSNQKVLPNTGAGNEISIFVSAAMTVLASLGLVATSKKKEE